MGIIMVGIVIVFVLLIILGLTRDILSIIMVANLVNKAARLFRELPADQVNPHLQGIQLDLRGITKSHRDGYLVYLAATLLLLLSEAQLLAGIFLFLTLCELFFFWLTRQYRVKFEQMVSSCAENG